MIPKVRAVSWSSWIPTYLEISFPSHCGEADYSSCCICPSEELSGGPISEGSDAYASEILIKFMEAKKTHRQLNVTEESRRGVGFGNSGAQSTALCWGTAEAGAY